MTMEPPGPSREGDRAENRLLFINAGVFRYGTDDKTHAAAIVLSSVLLVIGLLVVIIGSFSSNSAWLDRALMLTWNAFMFVAGVALGGGGKEKGDGQ
jgi:peptidoglycan/LPS O-acetylase OafA/YrhL